MNGARSLRNLTIEELLEGVFGQRHGGRFRPIARGYRGPDINRREESPDGHHLTLLGSGGADVLTRPGATGEKSLRVAIT